MSEKEMVNSKIEELADDLASEVSGGAEAETHCGDSILRKCKSVDSILRDDTNECTYRTKFIRSALADNLADGIIGAAKEVQAHCGESILRMCTDRILRNEEFGCTVGSKFIR